VLLIGRELRDVVLVDRFVCFGHGTPSGRIVRM